MKLGRTLHAHVREVCKSVVGVDHDQRSIELLLREGYTEILAGDVERLEDIALKGSYDVVLCGDLIEHLNNPGAMLSGVSRLMESGSILVISTPNAFGLMRWLQYLTGRFRESGDHVLSFSIHTLENLLERHGFRVSEFRTCFSQPGWNRRRRIQLVIGSPFFRLFPKLGGTLQVCAIKA